MPVLEAFYDILRRSLIFALISCIYFKYVAREKTVEICMLRNIILVNVSSFYHVPTRTFSGNYFMILLT